MVYYGLWQNIFNVTTFLSVVLGLIKETEIYKVVTWLHDWSDDVTSAEWWSGRRRRTSVSDQTFPWPAVEHRLDVLPGEHNDLVQLKVT